MTASQPYPIFLSIVIVARDDDRLEPTLSAIVDRVKPMVADFELILIDNGSAPQTRAKYSELVSVDGLPNIQVYRLLQTVDAETAYWAGIENSLGDYVLAHDPYNDDLSRLPEAIELALAGNDIVLISNAAREATGFFEHALGSMFRRLYRSLYGVDLLVDASQHRLISKRVISFLQQMSRPSAHYRSLPVTAGFQRTTIRYSAARRPKADHSFKMRARRAFNLIFSSALLPLRMISWIALLASLLNVAYSVYVVVIAIWKRNLAPGWTTLSLQQSGMFFLFSIMMLVFAEYLIRLVQWRMDGAAYFIVGEQTSAVLTRTSRLNVEKTRAEDL